VGRSPAQKRTRAVCQGDSRPRRQNGERACRIAPGDLRTLKVNRFNTRLAVAPESWLRLGCVRLQRSAAVCRESGGNPSETEEFGLRELIRNQQVTRSSRVAGSSFSLRKTDNRDRAHPPKNDLGNTWVTLRSGAPAPTSAFASVAGGGCRISTRINRHIGPVSESMLNPRTPPKPGDRLCDVSACRR
jgi:hypothetical protein